MNIHSKGVLLRVPCGRSVYSQTSSGSCTPPFLSPFNSADNAPRPFPSRFSKSTDSKDRVRTLQLKIGSIGLKSCDFLTWDDTPPPANPTSTAKSIWSKRGSCSVDNQYSTHRNGADKVSRRRVGRDKNDRSDGRGGDSIGTMKRKERRLSKGKSKNDRISGENSSSKIMKKKGAVRSNGGIDGDINRTSDADGSNEAESNIDINKSILSPRLKLRIPGSTSSSNSDSQSDSRHGSRSTSTSDTETNPSKEEWRDDQNESRVRAVPVTYVRR